MQFKLFLFISYGLGVVLLTSSCKNEKTQNGSSTFVANQNTNITFANNLIEGELNIVEYLYYYNGGGVAVGDINNDGLEDIYFAANQSSDKLYLNKGNLQFEDITAKSGIDTDDSWSNGVTIDDVNNDGYLDIYVSKVKFFAKGGNAHNLLYINQKNGTFKEMAHAYGVDFSGFSTQSCFIDYDKDGDLDLYLLNHAVHTIKSYGSAENRNDKDSLSGDLFFENKINEAEGKFVDVTQKAGIYSSALGYGLAVTCGDINQDGWPDLYVGNDFHENDYIYLNNGNKTFRESVKKLTAHTTQFSMGVDMADIDNDGYSDIFTTDMMPYQSEVLLVSGGEDSDNVKRIKNGLGFEMQYARNHLQLNNGQGEFNDIAYLTKTFATDWSWSVLLQDFDNNMLNDIFITSGIVKRPNNLDYINFLNEYDSKADANKKDRAKQLIAKMPSQPLHSLCMMQKSPLHFSPVKESFIGKPSFSTGAAYADFDKDGDLDIIVNNINAKAALYENTTDKAKHYLSLKLTEPNFKTSKGAKTMVYAANKILTREYTTTRGFMSGSTHALHFGLNDVSKVDSIIVLWNDGNKQLITNPKIDTEIKITKQENLEKYNYKSTFAIATVIQNNDLSKYEHFENLHYDENNEKLIPQRLSYEGPALLSEDLNGDGILDILLGGGRNQKARLYLGNKFGGYIEKKVPSFEIDAKYEDIDAATIDFDKDGDRDLYIVSGGGDTKELDKLFEDRLYLNNGNGDFRRVPLSLPHTNGSCIAVGDIDKDGYEDIFVGARSIPGFYGLAPFSFIIKNKQGTGLEIINKERFGMLTDVEMVDIDADNDLDIVACGDWSPIIVLENNAGQFTEKTKALGFDKYTGMWNTVKLTDLNNDGKLDILAGNMGLNTKLTASTDQPIKLYIGDFDKNGNVDPILFYYYFDRFIPFASLDKMISQMPILKKTYNTYEKFKNVDGIDDLFSNYKDNIIEQKIVTELRSMAFINQGNSFLSVPLPLADQISDINDFCIHPSGEIIYVGNHSGYVSELGSAQSNSGKILGKFDPKSNTFEASKPLALSAKVDARKVRLLKDNTLIVAINNGKLQFVTL